MDLLTTLGFAMGSAWLSGLSLYLTVATLGLLQRFGLAHLPGDLAQLSNWWIIGIAGGLYAIEFIADKIPAVDSVWHAIHTFIRIPAGAILAAARKIGIADGDLKTDFFRVEPAYSSRPEDRGCHVSLLFPGGY